MSERICSRALSLAFAVALFLFAPASRAQDESEAVKGIDSGNYNIQQSVELGYRGTWINGNQDAYDTFVDLANGPRVLDYTVHVRSLNHQGLLFDRLDFSNFGYGGDPNDVSRLRVEMNKWYEFSGVFRRDKYFWDNNLQANPFNPIPFTPSATTPALAATISPHALDLVHRMQDYDLTLLPQSRVRFRLGYSRHVEEGPAFTTEDATVEIPMGQNFEETTNAYRMGVDFRVLPKTTISYDQFLEYNKYDTVDFLASTPFLVSSPQYPGTLPVSLGTNFYFPPNAVTVPCAAPLLASGFVNNSNAASSCKSVAAYTRLAPARNSMPTERLSFQSTFIPRFEMSGSGSYTSAKNLSPGLYDSINEWTASTTSQVRDSIVSGPGSAKTLFAHANWSGIVSLTQKIRVVDSVNYDQWQNPGFNTVTTTDLFATLAQAAGQVGILLPYAQFAPMVAGGASFASICPAAGYTTSTTCPQHSSTAAADAATVLTVNYVAQRLVSNTIQVEGDLTKRISARVGYRYEDRRIAESYGSQTASDIYYPGGVGGTVANDFFAARGNCKYSAGTTTFSPAAGGTCTQNADGSVTWAASAATISSALTVPVTVFLIHQQLGLAGLTVRPMDTLRIDADFQLGSNDYSYTRVWPRQFQSYKVHANYRPRTWATVDGAVDIRENRDNVATINDLEHGRTYSFSVMLAPPNSKFAYTLGYNYTDLYMQTYICFDDSFGTMTSPALPVFPTAGAGSCVLGNTTPDNLQGGTAVYASRQHYVYSDVMWKPIQRVKVAVGYSETFTGGNTGVLNPVVGPGVLSLDPIVPNSTVAFNYLQPFASVQLDVYKGLSYKATWNYYGYDPKAPGNISIPVVNTAGGAHGTYALQPIPALTFNGNTATFSVRYAF